MIFGFVYCGRDGCAEVWPCFDCAERLALLLSLESESPARGPVRLVGLVRLT